jgi:hypothetical protein
MPILLVGVCKSNRTGGSRTAHAGVRARLLKRVCVETAVPLAVSEARKHADQHAHPVGGRLQEAEGWWKQNSTSRSETKAEKSMWEKRLPLLSVRRANMPINMPILLVGVCKKQRNGGSKTAQE